jgi:hypothetical protein
MGIFVKTYTFVNGQSADGGQVNTEITALGNSVNNITNAQIDAAAAIDISKTTLGTYTPPADFTPTIAVGTGGGTWSGTSVGYAKQCQIGKVNHFSLYFNGTAAGVVNYITVSGLTAPAAPADNEVVIMGTADSDRVAVMVWSPITLGGGKWAIYIQGTNTKLDTNLETFSFTGSYIVA